MAIKPVALQALVEKILVLIEMARVGRVHDLQLAHRVAKARDFQLFLHIRITPHDQRFAKPSALIGHGGAQHAGIVALGKNHPGLRLFGASMDALQDRRGRVHPRLERLPIGFQVDNRTTRDASIHARLGNGGRDHVDQPRIKGCGNDVIAPERQLAAIGHGNLIRHIFAGKGGKGTGAGDFHLVVDGAGVDVESAPEEIGEAQHIVDLIWVITAPSGHDGIGADGMGLFGGDFRVGVGHGKDHRVVGHGGDHLGRHGALDRHAQKHISAHHRLFQRAVIGTRGVGGFPLVHTLGAALIDHALGVAHNAVVMPRAHGFQ